MLDVSQAVNASAYLLQLRPGHLGYAVGLVVVLDRVVQVSLQTFDLLSPLNLLLGKELFRMRKVIQTDEPLSSK